MLCVCDADCLLHCPAAASVENKFVLTNRVQPHLLILQFFDAAAGMVMSTCENCDE